MFRSFSPRGGFKKESFKKGLDFAFQRGFLKNNLSKLTKKDFSCPNL